MLKKILILFAITCVLSLSGCHFDKNPNQLRVGTISGPETQLMEVAKKVAFKFYGLDIKFI